MIRLAVPLLLLATAATGAATEQRSPREQARLDRALKGLQPGKPQRCVPTHRVSEVRGFSDEILYVSGPGKVYRNKTVGTCSGLAAGDVIVTKILGSAYCAGDIVETRARMGGFLTGSCALGEFVPYTK